MLHCWSLDYVNVSSHTGAAEYPRLIDPLCVRSRRDVLCTWCSNGDVLTADLKSEDSWLVALVLKGSLSILCMLNSHPQSLS